MQSKFDEERINNTKRIVEMESEVETEKIKDRQNLKAKNNKNKIKHNTIQM